jgi:hypothetical protein
LASKEGDMAKPIKDTPILYGEESDRFLAAVKANENNKISTEEYNKIKEMSERILAHAKI